MIVWTTSLSLPVPVTVDSVIGMLSTIETCAATLFAAEIEGSARMRTPAFWRMASRLNAPIVVPALFTMPAVRPSGNICEPTTEASVEPAAVSALGCEPPPKALPW